VILKQLKRKKGFEDVQIYVRKQPHYALWVPVELTGFLSTSSSAFGYVYSSSELSPLVGNVWQEME
jgi:hypothetical protein